MVTIIMHDFNLQFMFTTLAAAYRFYRSCTEQDSLRRRGKVDRNKTTKRRHERIVRVNSIPSKNNDLVLYLYSIRYLYRNERSVKQQ